MKVILKQNYELLGDEGQIVEVKNGYARNYLVPRGIATIANESNLKNYEEIKKQKSKKIQKFIEDAKSLSDELAKQIFTIPVKTGEDDRVFGSVTSQMIHDYLVEKGFDTIEKKKILLREPIKSLGEHEVEIKLQQSVIAKIKINIVKETEIAKKEESVEAKEEVTEKT